MGEGIRIHGVKASVSDGLHNGDIWVEAGGNVYIRSGGSSILIA